MLVNLEKMATREKVVVISVNWRQNRDVFREIKGLFKKMDTDITLVSDPFGLAGTAYHVKGIPHMVIVGKDGKITAIHVGYDEAELPILVDELNSELLKTPSEGPTPKELPGIESIQSEPVDVEGEAE